MLIALAVIGYYVYQQFLGSGSEAPPSCSKAALNSCIPDCRRYTNDAPETQACQDACRARAEACEAKSGSGS